MIRNWIMGFCAMPAMLTSALPQEVRAQNEDRSNDAQYAENCAVEYARAALADFRFLERQMALRDRFDLDHQQIGLMAMMGDVSDVIPAEWIVESLAECDQTFGFSPATQLIDSRPAIPQSPMPQIADFDCAVAYRLLAAIRTDIDRDQQQAQDAMERTRHALGRHHAANPDLDPNSLGPQVNALAATRGQQIQQGQETAEALTNDINACEVKYGFANNGSR